LTHRKGRKNGTVGCLADPAREKRGPAGTTRNGKGKGRKDLPVGGEESGVQRKKTRNEIKVVEKKRGPSMKEGPIQRRRKKAAAGGKRERFRRKGPVPQEMPVGRMKSKGKEKNTGQDEGGAFARGGRPSYLLRGKITSTLKKRGRKSLGKGRRREKKGFRAVLHRKKGGG